MSAAIRSLRDLVNAIPYAAIQRGLLTVEKEGKKNVYNGRILEIEGLPEDLTVEQAFELSDASNAEERYGLEYGYLMMVEEFNPAYATLEARMRESVEVIYKNAYFVEAATWA